MASSVAHSLVLVKRGSAILVKGSDFGVLSRASAVNLERFILSDIQARPAEEAKAEMQTGVETAAIQFFINRREPRTAVGLVRRLGLEFRWHPLWRARRLARLLRRLPLRLGVKLLE